MTTTPRADHAADEFLRRLGEPEPLRSLRRQKERIEAERARAFRKAVADQQAAQLRREIEKLGEKPCA